MMLVFKLVVLFVVNLIMVKVVVKGMEEQIISQQSDLGSLFCFHTFREQGQVIKSK